MPFNSSARGSSRLAAARGGRRPEDRRRPSAARAGPSLCDKCVVLEVMESAACVRSGPVVGGGFFERRKLGWLWFVLGWAGEVLSSFRGLRYVSELARKTLEASMSHVAAI